MESFIAPLRVAIVVDSLLPHAWIARAIENIAASPHAELAAVTLAPAAAPAKESLRDRIDAKKFRTRDDALDRKDIGALLAHVPAFASEVDITIAFARTATRAWTISFDETVSTLRDADGNVLATASVAPDAISRHRAMNRLRWKSAALAARAIADLRRGVQRPAPALPALQVRAASPAAPGALRSIINYGLQKFRDVALHEQWMVAFSFDSRDPRAFHRIEPPKDRLWADPFVIQDGDRAWIFVEEMLFAEPRGVLAVIEARRDGTWSQPVRTLERPYHLSYPCVFRWNGAFWMVPETGGSGSVQLFRATDFPFRWEQHSELLRDIEAVDATPFEHDGRWWMYLTTPSAPNVYDELSLYSAATPEGPWTPHRLNPLFSDLAGGRCAGRPFLRHGTLVRAAQDSVKRYGHSMELREIVTLSEETWEERVVNRILPDWTRGLACTHTLNVDGEVTVIDGARDTLR